MKYEKKIYYIYLSYLIYFLLPSNFDIFYNKYLNFSINLKNNYQNYFFLSTI